MPDNEEEVVRDSAVAEVLEVERQWVQAHRGLDLESLERILDDHYAQLKPGGSRIGKQELLASYASGKRRWDVARSEPIRVEVLGDSALLCGRWTGKGVNDGESFDYEMEFIAVYRRRSDGWKLLADLSIPC